MDNLDKTSLQILFVEDSRSDVELAVAALESDGFEVSWEHVDTDAALLHALEDTGTEVVVSDYSIPGLDGSTVLRIVRESRPDIPFIFLSGTIGEERAIESVREGATDYVLKSNIRRFPFSIRRALSETRERARTRTAEQARARLAAILEATSDCVAICNPDGSLTYLNSAGQKMTGLREHDLTERNISSLHSTESWNMIMEQGWPKAVKKGLWHGETALISADTSEIPVSQLIITHRDSSGSIEYVSTIARDISDRKAYEKRIAYLASYDALTELPNRSLLSDRVQQAIAYRRSSDRSLALLIIDVDRFNLINSGYGQVTGDQLLRMVADRLFQTVREGDTVARLDADTFAVLATGLAHPDDTLTVARKIQNALMNPFPLKDSEFRITVSIGASLYPRDGTDFETLLQNAGAAMHRVKTEGQNSFRFYAENMTRDAADHLELENRLRGAADAGELELHYQPQVLLDSGHTVGVEALMRWNHPEHGWISPNIFIPIAEHSGCIHTIGEWALATACRQLKLWTDLGTDLVMGVNVSAYQFRDAGFAELAERVIKESGANAEDLVLELTEGVLVQDPERTARTLEKLSSLGVKTAVDDFGTGYSSLSYLSQLPLDFLKIDREFIRRIPGTRNDVAIVQAIISLAHSLDLDVIAEGIETNEQLQFLQDHDCKIGQGFLFHKPVPPERVNLPVSLHGS